MKITVITSLIYVILSVPICEGDTLDYGIFGNADATHHVYEKEQATTFLLEETLLQLKERRESINKALETRKVPVENITEFLAQQTDDYHPAHHPIAAMEILRQCVLYKMQNMDKLKAFRDRMSNLTEEMKNVYVQNEFDNKTMEGAKRSMVILQDTYDLDIRSMAEGKLESNSSLFNELSKEQIYLSNDDIEEGADVLTPKDLTDLALAAFDINLYSTAIKFLREGIWLLGKSTKEQHEERMVHPDLQKYQMEFKYKLVKVHNEMLAKHHAGIGEGFIFFLIL